MDSIGRVGTTESLPPSCTANAGSPAKRSVCSSCASRPPMDAERNRGSGAVARYRAPVEIRELAVPDSYVLDLVPHGDPRGRFTEWYRADVVARQWDTR